MKPGPSAASRNTKELFREQDVSLRWKTVQKTVRQQEYRLYPGLQFQ